MAELLTRVCDIQYNMGHVLGEEPSMVRRVTVRPDRPRRGRHRRGVCSRRSSSTLCRHRRHGRHSLDFGS